MAKVKLTRNSVERRIAHEEMMHISSLCRRLDRRADGPRTRAYASVTEALAAARIQYTDVEEWYERVQGWAEADSPQTYPYIG